MNSDQTQDQERKDKEETRAVGGQKTGSQSTEQEGHTEKHGSKSGAVLGEINDDPKKKSK